MTSLQENIDKLRIQIETDQNVVEKAVDLKKKIRYHEDLVSEMKSSPHNLSSENVKFLEFRIETRKVLVDHVILQQDQIKFLQERTDDILVSTYFNV